MRNRPQRAAGTTRTVVRSAWPQLLALLIGAAYTVFTVAGLVGAPDAGGLGHQDLPLGFGLSWVLLVVHAGTALWGLVAAARRSATKTFGVAMFMAYIGLSAYSVPAVIAEVDFLNVGWGNTVVYLLTAAAGLAISIGASAGKPFPVEPPPDTDEVM